jgi:hypothetical protein
MLFGLMLLLVTVLAIAEATAYWHARNVLADAAASGAIVAAAHDGSCDDGIEVARRAIARQSPGWVDSLQITCVFGPTTELRISGRTPGIVGGSLGFRASVRSAVPSER